VEEISDIEVVMTVLGGKVVYTEKVFSRFEQK
jgi:predicted amidohydrolase YtcJ